MLDQQTASEVMAEETSSKLPVGWSLTTLEVIVDIRDDLRQPINAEERAKRVGPYPY